MEINLRPETETRLIRLAALRGCKVEVLIEETLSGYFEPEEDVSATLDRRYDEMMNGTVKMLSPEELRMGLEEHKAEWLAKKG